MGKKNINSIRNFNSITEDLLDYEVSLFKYDIGQINRDKIFEKLDNFDLEAYTNIRYLINLVTLLKHSLNIIKLHTGLQNTTFKYEDIEEAKKINQDIKDICDIALKGIDGKLDEFDIDTDKYLEENSSIDKVLDMLKIKYNKISSYKSDDNDYDDNDCTNYEVNYKIEDDRIDDDNKEELIDAIADILDIPLNNPKLNRMYTDNYEKQENILDAMEDLDRYYEEEDSRDIFLKTHEDIHDDKFKGL